MKETCGHVDLVPGGNATPKALETTNHLLSGADRTPAPILSFGRFFGPAEVLALKSRTPMPRVLAQVETVYEAELSRMALQLAMARVALADQREATRTMEQATAYWQDVAERWKTLAIAMIWTTIAAWTACAWMAWGEAAWKAWR